MLRKPLKDILRTFNYEKSKAAYVTETVAEKL
jgi:hypothetical protein